jgi:hypothetical protein
MGKCVGRQEWNLPSGMKMAKCLSLAYGTNVSDLDLVVGVDGVWS